MESFGCSTVPRGAAGAVQAYKIIRGYILLSKEEKFSTTSCKKLSQTSFYKTSLNMNNERIERVDPVQ